MWPLDTEVGGAGAWWKSVRSLFCRENQRREGREKREKKKYLKNILRRHKIRRTRASLSHWHQWTRAKITRRKVVQAKIQSVQVICGGHLQPPQYNSQEEEGEQKEEEEKKKEVNKKESAIARFKCVVNLLIKNTRKEVIVQELLEKQKEKEVIEKCSFQFLSDDESFLYRKFLDSWNTTWDISVKMRRKERCMTLYHQSSPSPTPVKSLQDVSQSYSENSHSASSTSINSMIEWAENVPGIGVSVTNIA